VILVQSDGCCGDKPSTGISQRTKDGVGLGLSIVSTITELHGGHAHATNRPSGGAYD
jgi:signal transduction histidine kinase